MYNVHPQLGHRPNDRSYVKYTMNKWTLTKVRRTLSWWIFLFLKSYTHCLVQSSVFIFTIIGMWGENENFLLPTILCTLPGLIILHWICKSHWIWQRDICRSEVNHTEIGRAHIWKILNKIYQPYRIYGYPVHKVDPFENAGTWVTSYPVSRHVHWVYFEDDESIEESFIHSSAASPDGEVEWW